MPMVIDFPTPAMSHSRIIAGAIKDTKRANTNNCGSRTKCNTSPSLIYDPFSLQTIQNLYQPDFAGMLLP